MTNEKQDDAALNAYRDRVKAVVTGLKAELKVWIKLHDGDDIFGDPPADIASSHNSAEVTAALLETAIDRQIHLHGEKDARDLLMSAFARRAKALQQRFN